MIAAMSTKAAAAGRFLCCLGLAFLLSPTAAPAATVEEVVARYAEARGGLEPWRAVEGISWSGTCTYFSEAAPCTVLRTRDRYHFEHTELGNHVVIGRDEKGMWWIHPLFGFDWSWRTPGRSAAVFAREALLEPPLLGYREKGHQVELIGPDDIDGQPTLALRLTLADGQEETWHLDPETHLEVAVDRPVYDFTQLPQETTERAYYDDFRVVDGLTLPHYIEKEYGARHVVLSWDAIEVNPTLVAETFRRPLPSGMERLRPLVGTWELDIESRFAPQAPWAKATTTSTIEALLEGAYLVEHFDYVIGDRANEVVRVRTYDRFDDAFRFTHSDDFTSHLDIFTGTADADGERITLSNESTGTAAEIGGSTVLERQHTYDITPQGFKIDWERSTDGGETWFVATRYTYKRAFPPF